MNNLTTETNVDLFSEDSLVLISEGIITMTLVRSSTKYNPDTLGYAMKLQITASSDLPKEVFVRQRLKNGKTGKTEDVTVAVATLAQIEDFDTGSPAAGSSYYRADTAEWISSSLDYLNQIYTDVKADLTRLVADYAAIQILAEDETVEI